MSRTVQSHHKQSITLQTCALEMVQIKRDYNTVTQNNNHNNFTDQLSTETQLSAISNDVKQRMVSLRLMMSKNQVITDNLIHIFIMSR